MRCKCCNSILTTHEMSKKNDFDQYEDLCRYCKKQVYLDIMDLLVVREYQFEELTESLEFVKNKTNDDFE